MNLTGLIRNFGQYTDAQLEQMKTDLGIGLSLPKLKVCAAYYRDKAHRDPYIEELRFLDLFLEKASNAPAAIAPRELLTNDACVAKTYADLIEKRRELYPNSQKPASLYEAFLTMGSYLGRIGKTVLLPHEAHTLEHLRENPALAESGNIISAKDANCGFRRAFRTRTPTDATDILVLLAPLPESTLQEETVATHALLSDEAFLSAVKVIRPIGECGILYEALLMSQGVRINLDVLSQAKDSTALSDLVSAYVNRYLLRIANQSYDSLAKAAKNHGLLALPIATLADPSAVAIVSQGQPMLAWSAVFFRSLFELSPVSVHLADETDGTPAPIRRILHRKKDCAYLSQPTHSDQTIFPCGNGIYTVAVSAPTSSFFRNAIDTALSTVMTMCACGISYEQHRLAINIDLPARLTEDSAAGSVMSSILGLYRLEAELAIPMAVGKLNPIAALTNPEISVFGFANGKALPDRLCEAGHRLYCVMPEYEDVGIPNFDKLRTFLSWLTELSLSGTLKSARVICRKTVRQALSEMETDTLLAFSASGIDGDDRVLPLAVLLETDAEIDATFVGSTQPREINLSSDTEEEILLPEKHCLLPAKEPTVVICALSDDREAQKLAFHLTVSGAKVHLLTPEEDPYLFASRVLQSQTMILCKNAEIPAAAEAVFAAETLARANGYLLHLNGSEVVGDELPFMHLEALSQQNITQICKISNN